MKNVENTCRESGEEKNEDSVIMLYIHWQNLGTDSENNLMVL